MTAALLLLLGTAAVFVGGRRYELPDKGQSRTRAIGLAVAGAIVIGFAQVAAYRLGASR